MDKKEPGKIPADSGSSLISVTSGKAKKEFNIGFVDSGDGGLIFTIDALEYLLPKLNELQKKYDIKFNLVQIGDNINTPYGYGKSTAEVESLTKNLVGYALDQQKCDICVIACNTVSTAYNQNCKNYFKRKYPDQPVITIIDDSANYIYNSTKKHLQNNRDHMSIAVLATPYTIKMQQYHMKLNSLALSDEDKDKPHMKLIEYAPQDWVNLIESGAKPKAIKDSVFKAIKEVTKDGIEKIDSCGLFCTHFPLLKSYIYAALKKMGNKETKLFSQGEILSKNIYANIEKLIELKKPDLRDPAQNPGRIKILSLTTGKKEQMQSIAKSITENLSRKVDNNEELEDMDFPEYKKPTLKELIKAIDMIKYEEIPPLGKSRGHNL